MKRAGLAIVCCLGIAVMAGRGQNNAAPQNNQSSSAAESAGTGETDRGQQVFEQNCARCHSAPEGFSPRISGTVARHMRVRANLSQVDYKALMKFLHP